MSDLYIDSTIANNFYLPQLIERIQKELLKEIFQDLPEDINNLDYPYAYYTADYRIDESNIIDNTVMMRLRAWGPMVEVLLPGELRSRMAKDIQETWKLYHKSSQHK